MKSKTPKSTNLRNASNHFTQVSNAENNPAAAALAIHLWVESVDAYQAELAARRATTTTISGLSPKVMENAVDRGAAVITTHYNDGQKVTSPIVSFDGGYDDYDGALAWAEIPGEFPGKTTRFSPRPGQWMSGVRVQ